MRASRIVAAPPKFIDTFRERDTRDELGIGVVRDALSDLMFPGTSTVQTRATYFLLVPWCYLRAEEYARRTSAARDTLDPYTRDREIRLVKPLEAGGDVVGLLGRDAKHGLEAAAQRHLLARVGNLGHPALRRLARESSIATWPELHGEERWPSSPIRTRSRSGATASPPPGTRICPPAHATQRAHVGPWLH